MGCGSRLGKKDMHASEKPAVDQSRCVGCGVCAKNCAHGAITVTEHAHIDATKCAGCGRCIEKCPQKCMHPMDDRANEILSRKVAEYTAAVVRGRPCFHVALACDISPYCDCYALNDAPILEDIGMFASFDPVAMDQCCVDMANARKPLRNSLLYKREKPGAADHFTALFPETNWQAGLEQGEKLGIGTREYEMEEMA
mgnify:FL=1